MNKQELIINNFKDELLFLLYLELENNLDSDVVSQLEYETKELRKEFENLSDDEDLSSLSEYLTIADNIITKFNKKQDNETLLKKHFYITPAQLSFLDDYAEKIGLNGKGKRSLALRTILNNTMNK